MEHRISSEASSSTTNSINLEAQSNATSLANFIQRHIPSAYLKEETLREYQFVMPLRERANPSYWALFDELEANKASLRISSFGIHDVSLEEIFIKAAQIKPNLTTCDDHGDDHRHKQHKRNANARVTIANDLDDDQLIDAKSDVAADTTQRLLTSADDNDGREDSDTRSIAASEQPEAASSLYNLDYMYEHVEVGYRLYAKQFAAIFVKRYLYNKRNWKSLLTQIILPACFICIGKWSLLLE